MKPRMMLCSLPIGHVRCMHTIDRLGGSALTW